MQRKKRDVRRELKSWRKEERNGNKYRKEKLEYKEVYEKKKKDENDK